MRNLIAIAAVCFAGQASASIEELCDIATKQNKDFERFIAYAESRANSVKSAVTSAALAGQDTPMFRKAGENVSAAMSSEAAKQREAIEEWAAQLAGLCRE